MIQRCPTGALHFRRLDGGSQEPVPEETTVQERPNGPLFVRGNVRIFGQDQDSWDRYAAAQWLNIRRWLDANPDDELTGQMRAELATSPAQYARYGREYLGWGVFALMNR